MASPHLAAVPDDLYLSRLGCTHFRNLEPLNLDLQPGLILVSGPNGVGKTNLLDAVYYLCLTRSHFTHGDSVMVQRGQRWFRLEGDFSLGGKTQKIAAKVQPGSSKVFERNGSAYDRLADHIGLLPAVMIAPDDIELATGGPDLRRRFIDQTIAQYDRSYLDALLTYNRVLKQRNAFLKAARHPLEVDLTLLAGYDRQLLGPAKQMVSARSDFASRLSEVVQEIYARISSEAERPSVRFESQLLEMDYAEQLQRHRDQDLVMRRTHAGPHRDDLDLQLDDRPVRRHASQGQLKSLVLSLKLAQARLLRDLDGVQPLLLLDDIFDRLDENRAEGLMSILGEEGFVQVFVSDTHATRLEALAKASRLATQHLSVRDGVIRPIGRDQ